MKNKRGRRGQDQDIAAGRLVAVIGGVQIEHHAARQGDVHPIGRFGNRAQVGQLIPADRAIRVEDLAPGRLVIGSSRTAE